VRDFVEAVLVILAILALIGGSVLLLRQRSQPWMPTILQPASGDTEVALHTNDVHDALPDPGHELARLSAAAPADPLPIRPSGGLQPVRLDLPQTAGDDANARLDLIEDRLDELLRATVRQSDHADEARRVYTELIQRAEAEEARRDAAHERLRADLLALVSRALPERQPRPSVRRTEVSAELYAHLARLEAALATVTNPILLPGELYTPPAELPPESLVWENWNEVGERAFTLAETYSAQRLHLSAQARTDVGAFVTTLRTLLTRSVYPNVQANADQVHQAGLQAALAEIADELPKVRELLETEYLEGLID
jgi:hypothetical protein